MMNFDTKRDAIRIIEEVFELTGEDYLYRVIDKPIEEAAADFEFDVKASMTHRTFLRTIGDFVYHIYKNGFCISQTLSMKQARAEAISTLEAGYIGSNDSGYHAAFLDVSNYKLEGNEFILTQIAEIIKGMAREKHIKWIYSSRIAALDWRTRCRIADTLFKRWKPFLPPNIHQSSPAQHADYLPDLIEVFRSTDGTVRKMLSTDIDLNSI